MPRVLQDNEVDLEEEGLDSVLTADEEAAERASLRAVPDQVGDLTDGGQVGRARVFPMENGQAASKGRAAARRAWTWNGSETLLPLAWNPEGTVHDGARPYLRKKHCLCCHQGGFKGRQCPNCVRNRCVGCGGSTDPKKIIANFYLSKEKVPFPQRFYGDIPCFLPMCPRQGSMGFKADEDMRMHARTAHRMEYESYQEAQQFRRADETESLRRRLDEMGSLLMRARGAPEPEAAGVGAPAAPLYVKEPKPKK